MDSEIHYCQWQTTDRVALATLTTTFEEYKELFIGSINNLTRHSYLAKAQARYVKSKKESLGATKVMVLGDFAENYQYLTQDEIQSFHWSKEYCTLHPLVIYYKDADGNLQHYSLCFISDDNTLNTSFVHNIQTLLVEFLKQRLWTSQSSITFLMVVVGSIKIQRTSLIYVPIKRTFPSKQNGFSLQLAMGKNHVMKLVVWQNAMLQSKVCRDHSTTMQWWMYAKKKLNQLSSLALTKKTWSRCERRWRRGSKMVRWYLVQEAVIISFPSQHHKLDTNCAVRMTCLWTSMTSKFQLELILATLHHHHTSLVCTIRCGGSVWWTKLIRSKVM